MAEPEEGNWQIAIGNEQNLTTDEHDFTDQFNV